jgi:hypothetical protein
MNRKTAVFYDKVEHLARAYFGPDGARHIDKIVEVHLRKPPQKITKNELVGLIDLIEEAATFMAEDKNITDQYIKDLLALAESN